MKKHNTLLTAPGLILVCLVVISSCSVEQDDSSSDESEAEHAESAESGSAESGSDEHGTNESGGEERGSEGTNGEETGEESGTQYTKTETYDETRNGARLVMNYDSEANAFTGTVENTTDETLTQVRIEVHLSNGTELGPTKPNDLDPGTSVDVTLFVFDEEFDTWGAHPEVGESGSAEHGSEENHD